MTIKLIIIDRFDIVIAVFIVWQNEYVGSNVVDYFYLNLQFYSFNPLFSLIKMIKNDKLINKDDVLLINWLNHQLFQKKN